MANKFISKEKYLKQKRQEIIDKSLENSNNRILPTVPYIERESEEKWYNRLITDIANIENIIENGADEYKELDEGDLKFYTESLNALKKELSNGYGDSKLCAGSSCIYTATDNFGKKYRVSGNKSFRTNPSKYGFVEIGLNEIVPGDIIQDFKLGSGEPNHAITFVGYDKNNNNNALFNYSSGGSDETSIKKNAKYPFYLDFGMPPTHLNGENNNEFKHNAAAYRFVGTEDDNKEWEKQYYIDRSNFHKQIAEELKQVPILNLPNKVTSVKRLGGKNNNENILNIIERYIKTKAMAIAQGLQYNDFRLDTTGSDIVNNKHDRVGEASYLYNKKDFENAYLNSGYIKGKEGDYGLVQKAVGNRNLPIFQKNIDDAARDDLIVLGNPKEDYIAPNKRLYDAGEYPTAMYIDKNGNVYQKAWDLNDYGKDAKGHSGDRGYSNIKQKAANFLDRIGNPHVVTTGFVKLNDAGLKYFLNNEKEDINIQRKILQYENNKNIALEYLNHLDTLYQNGSEYINKRLYELLNDKIDKKEMGGIKQNKTYKLKGGMAVPLDNKKKLFYLSGAKHEQGGIDITPELEAEGGEVIKVNPKSIKVVTAQKIMGGKSPAELVVNASSTGEQDKVFNEVFKYQEDFKDRHDLNDDGTKKAKWGIMDKIRNSRVFKRLNWKNKNTNKAYTLSPAIVTADKRSMPTFNNQASALTETGIKTPNLNKSKEGIDAAIVVGNKKPMPTFDNRAYAMNRAGINTPDISRVDGVTPAVVTAERKPMPTFDNRAYIMNNNGGLDILGTNKNGETNSIAPAIVTAPKKSMPDFNNKASTTEQTKNKLLNAGDWINIGVNSLGALTNLITGLATPNIKYARMRDSIPIMAPKINSNVNTTAEENAIDESYYNELNAINENTANSQTALNRKRNAAARRAAAKVKIRSAAENTRRGLINEGNKLAAEYQKYNIARQENVDAYNRQAEAAEFNANRTKVGDAITGFVNDLGQGASTITNAIEKRKADRINTVLSYMGNPEVNPDEFNKGFDQIYENLYGKKPSKSIKRRYNKR